LLENLSNIPLRRNHNRKEEFQRQRSGYQKGRKESDSMWRKHLFNKAPETGERWGAYYSAWNSCPVSSFINSSDIYCAPTSYEPWGTALRIQK
jgi:hypothetical protein